MDGTSIAALVGEEMARAEQAVLPRGEISRRLQALGWSSRGFADEIGVAESTMRRIDSGERLLRHDLVAQREAVVRWIEMEEKLRLANPMPVWPGRDPVGVSAKHRRRPNPRGRRVSGASEVSAGEGASGVPAPVPAAASEASEVEAVPEGWVRLLLPGPGLPSLDLAEDAPVDQRVVRLVVECVGQSPKRIAEMMDAPAVGRTLRRWLAGADPAKHPIRAESAAWLRDVLGVLRSQPADVTAWVRYRYMMQVWRSEAKPAERDVLDAAVAVMSRRPPAGIEAWEDAVLAALQRRPEKLAAYQGREDEPEVRKADLPKAPAGKAAVPAADDPSVVPGVSVRTFTTAVRRVLRWIAGDGSLDDLGSDEEVYADVRAALRETHVRGMTLEAWVEAAQAKLEAAGYALEEGAGDQGEVDEAPPAPAPNPEAQVVSDRRGQAEGRPRLGLPRKPLVDLTRGEG